MEITWHGYSCFRITERSHTSVVTDPFRPRADPAELRLKADLVTLSHERAGRQVGDIRERKYLIAGPGEYEVGELFVKGIALHRHDADKDAVLRNVAYHFEYPNSLNVLHLGALRQLPDQSVFEEFDQVNALLLPLDGAALAGDRLADLISVIEPNFVAPMQPTWLGEAAYAEALASFLKAMGAGAIEPLETLRLTPPNLPERTQVVLLRANHKGT